MQKQVLKSVVAVATVVASAGAMAALPTEASTAFGTISTNVTEILAAIWPIVALSTGGFILIKLFKKGANKAA